MDELQTLYRRHAGAVRGTFGGDAEKATGYYRKYVSFVSRAAPPRGGASLLDVGCGSGWSAYSFARQGYRTTGVDLNEAAFEPPPTPELELRQASVLALPFPDAQFDVVAAYQMLEHIPDPGRALDEMLRVCKPGGMVCIAGPNLLSVVLSAKAPFLAFQNRPIGRAFRRSPDMPRHPFGNTLLEGMAALPINLCRILVKVACSEACFTMREPDRRPPFYSDNDACYVVNPIDLTRFFSRCGCRIVQNGYYGRPRVTLLLAGGTWFAARKPA